MGEIKYAERKLIALVRSGEWSIDDQGQIWRTVARRGLRAGGFHLIPCERRRAEKPLPHGYLMVRAMFNGVRICGQAHRLVWQHLYGDIPEGMEINHKDGRKDNNAPGNLELMTTSENVAHARRVLGGGDQRGEKNHQTKLTAGAVATIRARRRTGERLKAIASDFGITDRQVSKICLGHRWNHVPEVSE